LELAKVNCTETAWYNQHLMRTAIAGATPEPAASPATVEPTRSASPTSVLDYGHDFPASKLPSGSSAGTDLPAIKLPSIVLRLLRNPSKHSIPANIAPAASQDSLVVADTGATDHMDLNESSFVSYRVVHNLRVRMGNRTYARVAGRGTAIFSLNGKCVLVRNVLHVPSLSKPLYSLRAHLNQPGCGFIGTYDSGFHVYFPSFILSVDTSSDCHLSYKSLGRSVQRSDLEYHQPKCPPNLYPSEQAHAASNTKLNVVNVVEDEVVPAPSNPADEDEEELPPGQWFYSHTPKQPPKPKLTLTRSDIETLATNIVKESSFRNLSSLSPAELVDKFFPPPPLGPPPPALPSSISPSDGSSPPGVKLLSTMSREEVLHHLHHPNSQPPPVRPCDTSNPSDTKTSYSAEEAYRVFYRKLRNWRHLIQTSKDGTYVEGGESFKYTGRRPDAYVGGNVSLAEEDLGSIRGTLTPSI
jgi:hypothetical protein